jgi:son of sevenless-like protein
VYYHNTLTGEDSWEIPLATPSLSDDETYTPDEEDYLHSLSSTTQSDAYAASTPLDRNTDNDNFQAPPEAIQGELPYPWVARLSDDGREWYYQNRETGERRKTPPLEIDTTIRALHENLNRLSTSTDQSTVPPPAPRQDRLSTQKVRQSVEVRRKAIDEWQIRTSDTLTSLLAPPTRSTLSQRIEAVNESLRQVFEAGVAGSAAEEEMSRARDLGSHSGMSSAILREDGAVEMMRAAHEATLARIRELLASFGYVGPMGGDAGRVEGLESRPDWAGDISLIGSIGLLSATIHAAVTSKRQARHDRPNSGSSEWAEVLRAASRLKDVIAGLPGNIFPEEGLIGAQEGKELNGWLGVDKSSLEVMSGKWGFGIDGVLKILDENTVEHVTRLKTDFEEVLTRRGDILSILGAAERYKDGLLNIDIAASIDVDGDSAEKATESETVSYSHLVSQSVQDTATKAITTSCVLLLYSSSSSDITQPISLLSRTISTSYTLLSSLLVISQSQQKTSADSTLLRVQIGARSPQTHLRPQSIVSSQSRLSRISDRSSSLRARVRGLEEEFLDQEDLDAEKRDKAAPLSAVSASGSQISLPGVGSGKKDVQSVSAASSTTSLAYQKSEASESGSGKGNRSSFMKFMRGRSGSDVLGNTMDEGES